MENKYNLDFIEAMDSINDYFDVIEDNMNIIKDELKDNPEHLEVILNEMKNDAETIDDLEKKALLYLIEGDYQSFLEQLMFLQLDKIYQLQYHIFTNNTKRKNFDLFYLNCYLNHINR